jgi:hypothetical protein
MFRKSMMICVALLIGLLLPIASKAEGTDLFQRYYSPKLALQTEKWMLSNDVLWLSEEAEQDTDRVRERPKAGVGTYAVEFAGAISLSSSACCISGLILARAADTGEDTCKPIGGPFEFESELCLPIYKPWLFNGLVTLGAVVAPLSSALGVTSAGKSQKQKGSFWGALAGSVAGELLPILFASYNVWSLIALPITIPLGAVIGYNYKALLKGDLRAIGEILVGSTVGTVLGCSVCCIGYLILSALGGSL